MPQQGIRSTKLLQINLQHDLKHTFDVLGRNNRSGGILWYVNHSVGTCPIGDTKMRCIEHVAIIGSVPSKDGLSPGQLPQVPESKKQGEEWTVIMDYIHQTK
jgi:hypothetical protein